MPLLRTFAFVLTVTLCSGCGFVHLGRLPGTSAIHGGPGGGDAYAELRLEQKLLQHELALVRKESDGLRAALEQARAGSRSSELRQHLEHPITADEPAKEPNAAAPNEVVASRMRRSADLDPTFVATLREQARLQDENARLHRELARARSENAVLLATLKTATAQGHELQTGTVQLDSKTPLAEGARTAEREFGTAQASTVAGARAGTTPDLEYGLSAFRHPRAPPAEATGTMELLTSPTGLSAPVVTEPVVVIAK